MKNARNQHRTDYAKELIKGESYVALSDEEKEAIERAKTLDEEIADIMEEE